MCESLKTIAQYVQDIRGVATPSDAVRIACVCCTNVEGCNYVESREYDDRLQHQQLYVVG